MSRKTKSRSESTSSTASSGSESKLIISKDLLEKLEKERQRALAEKKKWKEQVRNVNKETTITLSKYFSHR